MPKISIIVPVYNVEQYLVKCLESILNQTFKDFELICIDDCSTDNSLHILRQYAEMDKRITVVELKQNKKQGGARNAGLDIAKGEYITFIDADDFVESAFIEKMYNAMKEHKSDLIVTNVLNISENKEEKELKQELDLYYKNMEFSSGKHSYNFSSDKIRTGPVAKLYRKDIIDKHNIRFPEYLIQEDEAFYWFYMPYVKNLYYINENLYYRLIHETSTMYELRYNNKNIYDHLIIIKKIFKYLKKNKIFKLYKNTFIEYVETVIKNKKDKKLQKHYLYRIALFLPEILRIPINEFILELKFLYILFTKKKLVCWGASLFLKDFINKYNIKTKNILGIIDKNPQRQGEKIRNYEIFAPEKLEELHPDYVIFTIKNNSSAIYKCVKEYLNNYKQITLLPNYFEETYSKEWEKSLQKKRMV